MPRTCDYLLINGFSDNPDKMQECAGIYGVMWNWQGVGEQVRKVVRVSANDLLAVIRQQRRGGVFSWEM
jgi:hypothetical protein